MHSDRQTRPPKAIAPRLPLAGEAPIHPYGFLAGRDGGEGCDDAAPVLERLPDGRVFACVADGLGGYPQGFDGKSGGFIASRTVSRGALEYFQRYPQKSPEADALSLTEYLGRKLKRLADEKLPPTRVKGTLGRHKLASTLACLLIQERPGGAPATARIYWIGDSRIYFLGERGLHLLTRDDTLADVDAFDGVFQDSPMSQFLAASMDPRWRIHGRELVLEDEGVLLACTDGCTAYWKRPWDFELTLISAFDGSTGWSDWVRAIKTRVDAVRADDASLIAWPVGDLDFARFRTVLLARRTDSAAARADSTAARGRLSDRSIWRTIYRPSYEKMLPDAPPPWNGPGILRRLAHIARSLWPFT